MVRRPDSSDFSPSISDGFDDSKNYRVRLIQVEERESQFSDAKKRSQVALVWHLAIFDEDGVAFTDTNSGEVFDLWAWTSDSTFANASTGQRAKARQYAEAFMGRELSDDEVNSIIDQGFAETLQGKTALGSFEVATNNDGNARITVVKLRPLKKEKAQEPVAAATASRATAASSAREQVNRARQAPRQQRIDDEF